MSIERLYYKLKKRNLMTKNIKNNIIERGVELSKKIIGDESINPWSKADELKNVLADIIKKKEPFSMIRLGDGEGRILGYPVYYSDQEISHQVLTYQYGGKVIPLLKSKYPNDTIFCAALKLKYGIIEAINNADILGLPSWLHFRTINENNLNPYFAQALCFTETTNLVSSQKIAYDHYIFRPFHENNLFHELFCDLETISIISHTDASELLKRNFGFREVNHYSIPGHQSFMKNDEPQYPNFYLNLLKEISVPHKGHVFLVCAGYLGKIYCDEIKKKGGIAIDIGAIFDAWTGIGRANETKNEQWRLT